jgi:hypothetical protein
MPKVIGLDNHDRDGISDYVAAENISQEAAEAMCANMNEGLGDGPGRYYVVKPDDYKPYVFEGW